MLSVAHAALSAPVPVEAVRVRWVTAVTIVLGLLPPLFGASVLVRGVLDWMRSVLRSQTG
ncbi:MAG: hypothetical protein DI606_11160 [Sphingobium sp.]|nr:MAG: hypothetical protein DI606_11160 [Sphingobium sp.]